MGRSVLLLVNRGKPQACDAVDEVRGLIEKFGRLAAEKDADDTALGGDHGAELIVVLGGDGTLLAQARRCVELGLPMIGINAGRLGYLAEFDLAALREQAAELFGGAPLALSSRMLIRASTCVAGASRSRHECLAMNDCVVTAGPPFRMIEVDLRIDGHQGPTLRGDGLVISSPSGSTAYGVSAGGPIVSPELDSLTIVPIAAHSLAFRPIVVPAETRVELLLRKVNEGDGGGTTLVLDGQVQSRVYEGETITFSRHERSVQLVRNPRTSYWQTLRRKLHWAASPGDGRD